MADTIINMIKAFVAGAVVIRQILILTYIVDFRTEGINIFPMVVDP